MEETMIANNYNRWKRYLSRK